MTDLEDRKKISRSLKLEPDINDRLISLCAHLGVNPNAYLLNEVGKAISRDEVAYRAGVQAQASQNQMLKIFEEMMVAMPQAIEGMEETNKNGICKK